MFFSISISNDKANANDVFLTADVRAPAITISIPNNTVSLDLVTDATALATGDLSVFVTTSNSTGYTLMMSGDSSDLTGTEKINDVYPTIPTLLANTSAAGFAASYWGFKLANDALYHPFDETGTQVGYSDTAADNKEEKITFASKVNYNIPTGQYSLRMSIAGVVNPKIPEISDYDYMQDLASLSSEDKAAVLASMTTGAPYNLSDSRDSQKYTVAKLIDGKVWMTRNLAIGCAGSDVNYSNTISAKNLTAQDSNVSSSFTTPITSLSSGDSTTEARMACSSTHGAYYNYVAASVGTNGETYDVCPAGWRLPTYSEELNLVNTIGNSPSTFNPTNSGAWHSGSYGYKNNGYWWSSTAYDANKNWYMYTESNKIYRNNNFDRTFGLSVRCVLK